jgi:hypothetical protein
MKSRGGEDIERVEAMLHVVGPSLEPPADSSNPLELADCPFVLNIPGVQGGSRFDQDDVHFLVGHGKVLDAAGHNHKFAFAHDRFVIPEFHAQRAFDYQKKLVLVVVVMPDKFAFQFDGLHLAVVYFADHARVAVILEFAEFVF